MSEERFKLAIWRPDAGYDVNGDANCESYPFATFGEAKREFHRQIENGVGHLETDNCLVYAAVYDTSRLNQALLTFPSYWDGHDHRTGQGHDPEKWKGDLRFEFT